MENHPRSAFARLGKLLPEKIGNCHRGNQSEDGLKHRTCVVGAIKTSAGNVGDFRD
jgi:hypothetical protein